MNYKRPDVHLLTFDEWVLANLHTKIYDMNDWEVKEHYKHYLKKYYE